MTTTDPAPAQPGRPAPRLLTPAQVAAILGGDFTAGTIVRRWKAWGLHPIKIGRELRFLDTDIHDWINHHQE